jgi:hypothetical protein
LILFLWFFFAPGPSYQYWVQPCTSHAGSGCLADDPELADWAFDAWKQASGGKLGLTRVKDEQKAQLRLYWAGLKEGLYGEARPITVDGKQGAEVYVRPAEPGSDPLLRDAVVYLTCLHETGHALGLPHTSNFYDIMYSFQFGGDIEEYFGRYRRKLKTRNDIRWNSGLSEFDRDRLRELLK